MNSVNRSVLTLVALTSLVVLGGCLSEEKTDTGLIGTPPPDSGNSAPSISGSPAAAVKSGEQYLFTPSASDPDGDTLTFSVQNKPSWADFDVDTGSLSGIPTLGNTGMYSGVVVSVSDGDLSSSTPTFSIEVTSVATASTTLSWSAPTQNEDGSMLMDLRGFVIHYGKTSGTYSNQIRIDNPTVTTYVVDNLSPGTYFFTATAFNASGVESRLAGEISKTLN